MKLGDRLIRNKVRILITTLAFLGIAAEGDDCSEGMGGSGGRGADTSYQPWSGYWNEYPAKYHYLMYRPGDHGAGDHHDHADHTDPDQVAHHDYVCSITPPNNTQIRNANAQAINAAKYIESNHSNYYDRLAGQADLRAKGYTLFDLGVISELGGEHWIHWGFSGDGITGDAGKPENTIYLNTAQGFRPIGVMLTSGNAPGPAFGGCLTFWHIHQESTDLGYMMHVWIYGAPEGPFSEPHDCQWYNMKDCIEPHGEPLGIPRK